jgi:hypothetical protein
MATETEMRRRADNHEQSQEPLAVIEALQSLTRPVALVWHRFAVW